MHPSVQSRSDIVVEPCSAPFLWLAPHMLSLILPVQVCSAAAAVITPNASTTRPRNTAFVIFIIISFRFLPSRAQSLSNHGRQSPPHPTPYPPPSEQTCTSRPQVARSLTCNALRRLQRRSHSSQMECWRVPQVPLA